MNTTVNLTMEGTIGLITINNPPVNAINQNVRAGVKDAFQTLSSIDGVEAVVILCEGRTFAAGADIKEFDQPIKEPSYYDVFSTIENFSKPVVAAMHGTALGAGLETALACHYRCALTDAQMGLPEISLGIIPGAGGSQRLPRLIGAKSAIEFIFGISSIDAKKAMELGIIDYVIDEELRAGALKYVRSLLKEENGPRKTSEMAVDVTGFDAEFLAEARKKVTRQARGQHAPELVIEAIQHAINLSFDEGLQEEKRIAESALVSDEAKALRYAFFSERLVSTIPNLSKDIEKLNVSNVAILGSGTMGGGIAMAFANVGIKATVVDVSNEALDHGLGVVEKNYQNSLRRARFTEKEVAERMSLIHGTTDYNEISDHDLVIEAVFEDFDLKKQIFSKLDEICKPEAILATNTSTLDVDAIALATQRPEQVVGLHFFSPANVMKLLEIVRAKKTSPQVLATSIALAKRLKKVGVVAGVCFGFIGNRMMIEGFYREADQMLLEGASPEQIDRILYEFGFPMGPFGVADMAGIDVLHRILDTTGKKKHNPEPYFNVLYQLGELKRFGQKNGSGFYRYEEGSRSTINDPLVDELIEIEAKKLGLERAAIEDSEIRQRCLFALINEGIKILEEGIAYRPSDIDMIWVHGYGFPRVQGGPMYLADQIGIGEIYKNIMVYNDKFGTYWKPSKLLQTLAGEGKSLADWDKDR